MSKTLKFTKIFFVLIANQAFGCDPQSQDTDLFLGGFSTPQDSDGSNYLWTDVYGEEDPFSPREDAYNEEDPFLGTDTYDSDDEAKLKPTREELIATINLLKAKIDQLEEKIAQLEPAQEKSLGPKKDKAKRKRKHTQKKRPSDSWEAYQKRGGSSEEYKRRRRLNNEAVNRSRARARARARAAEKACEGDSSAS